MIKNKYKFIVVEGPIGVGKTTLATKLANTFNSKLMLESYSNNPFLKKFYKDMSKYAFTTQLYFLLQRASEFQSKANKDIESNNIISDYFFNKDNLFAETILNIDEYSLYNKIFKHLNISMSKPDLVIYLQADASALLKRITARGIDFEQYITEDYLKKIIDSYTKYFYSYNDSPILIINTSSVDVNNVHDYNMLVGEINKDIKGKKYFNPSSLRKD